MRHDELLLRQRMLQWHSARLRVELGGHMQAMVSKLSWLERARAGTQWLMHHPQWPLGALAALAVLRPRRSIRWAGRVWWAWRLFQQLRRTLG